jgi:peptidoglycan/LPS O-acetylase OafA/YrhL
MHNVFKEHVASLDGLRALAVMSVMAIHSGVPGFQSGWLGVDLFFALSGFLITTLLLKEHDKRGGVSLRNFFARRFLRLMPAYLVYIAGITAAMWLWSGSELNSHGGWSPELYTVSLWTYFVNFAPKGGIWNGQSVTVHLWSLAVEEQYYLIWPAAMLLFIRSRYLMPIAWGGALVTLSIFIGSSSEFARGAMLYARGMSLFIASALAVTLWWSPSAKRHIVNAASSNLILIGILALTCLCFAVGSTNILNENHVLYYFLPWLACGFALIVIRCAATDAWVPGFLTHPWLVQIGRISYGIYLYHELTRVGVWFFTSELLSGTPKYFAYGLRLTLYFFITLLLAGLSYRFLELPFLQMKSRFRA